MVRGAVTGAVDYSRYDPHDSWWWTGLWWRLGELHRQHQREVAVAEHQHWVTLASHGRLEPDSFEMAMTNAKSALQRLLIAHYPWIRKELEESGQDQGREGLVDEFRRRWGYPGDPQYEKMMEHNRKVFEAAKSPRKKRLLRRSQDGTG